MTKPPKRREGLMDSTRRGKKAAKKKNERPVDPNAVLFPLWMAIAYSGLSRSSIYRHLRSKKLRARKDGRTLLIEGDSLRALKDELPEATFQAP